MNFLKKGPELKLSEIKVPDFLLDLFYDLRERHMLPVAAVLLVAILAVPIALSQSGGGEEESADAAGATAEVSAASASNQQIVARSAPRLREYRRRLSHLKAKDPFVQQYSGNEAESEVGETSSSGGPAPATALEATGSSPAAVPAESSPPSSVPSEPIPSSVPTAPSPAEGASEAAPAKGKWFSYAIDVRVVPTGQAQASASAEPKATVRRNLPELTMLPNRETPAIVYMGSTKDGKKALMMVSSDVTSIFGDAKCVLGSQTCQLLLMEPNLPETFVYGGSGKTYKIELRKIHLVESNKINRASLGAPPQKKSGD